MSEEKVISTEITEELARWEMSRKNLEEEYLTDLVKTAYGRLESASPNSDTSQLMEDILALVAQLRWLREENKHLSARLGEIEE